MPLWLPPKEFDGYRLVRLLGHGTMGRVFLADDALLERPVAIKVLSARDPRPQETERLLLEARAIARLAHPNVVAIYRVGECQGRPYLVSEYVRGESLDKLPKPIPWERALHIGVALSRGLAAAHARGVVHRDIKPANALLAETGEAKLLDFGLAKLIDTRPAAARTLPRRPAPLPQASAVDATADLPPLGEPAPLVAEEWPELDPPAVSESETLRPLAAQARGLEKTREGAILGTPLYMAAECWRGEAATFRSDVFSLGAVLYQLASGRPPSEGPGIERVREATLSRAGAPEAPLSQVDARLAKVILKCLRTDPAERYESGAELRDALESIQKIEPKAPPPLLAAPPLPERRRRSPALFAAALALLGALAAGSVWASHTRSELARVREALSEARGRCGGGTDAQAGSDGPMH